MKLTEKESDDHKIITFQEFINIYHPGLSVAALSYAAKHDLIDYVQPVRDRFVVLTKKSLDYKPRKSKNR